MVFIQIPVDRCSCCKKRMEVPAIVIATLLKDFSSHNLCFCSINCYALYLEDFYSKLERCCKFFSNQSKKEQNHIKNELSRFNSLIEKEVVCHNKKQNGKR